MFPEKSEALLGAQYRMVEFYLAARGLRGRRLPDRLEDQMESARWWMGVVKSNRPRCTERPLAHGGFRLRVVESVG